jgi:hypothetical protein
MQYFLIFLFLLLCSNLWINSDQMLAATFNPASLLSFGDALAFGSALQEAPQNLGSGSTSRATTRASTMRSLSSIPPPSTPSVGRAPQKYLVQNQSGMRLHYWADARTGVPGARSPVYSLDDGASESLRVVPATKSLNFVQLASASVAGSERVGSVINLHFEGNWMPIRVSCMLLIFSL